MSRDALAKSAGYGVYLVNFIGDGPDVPRPTESDFAVLSDSFPGFKSFVFCDDGISAVFVTNFGVPTGEMEARLLSEEDLETLREASLRNDELRERFELISGAVRSEKEIRG